MMPHLAAVLPEIVVLASACIVLVADLFVPQERRAITFWLTQAGLLVALVAVVATAQIVPVKVFGGMVVADLLGGVLKLFAVVAVSLMLFYARGHLAARGLYRGELFVLTLFSLLGMMVMMSGANLVTLYLGLELMSLAFYALVALRRDVAAPSEAAMKYFVLGALASGMLLYGFSMLYGATGSLDLDAIAQATLDAGTGRTFLVLGLVFVVSGIAFKLGAVPYHMWLPDVYHGAPTPVTLLVGTAPKLAAFAFTLRLLAGALKGLEFDWQGMLIVLSLLSMVLGNLIAIAQVNLKRMLAYSTIAHMGFMLLGFLAADLNGFSAAMFYAVAYVLMSLVAFGMILLLSRDGFEADLLDDFRGLNRRSPWWAFVMLLAMFSLAGIPPTIGFYAKFAVIEAVVNQGFVWLAVVAVLSSVVGAFYYLRVVKLMYFDDPTDTAPIVAPGDARVLLSANGLLLLVLGIAPQILMGLCTLAVTQSHF
ncbi:MAG: NADH-quinone oxidoreductase subunit NuoN [Burkholderiales bacterium]|jgi:NADH-quinone oxidoreductase subunit N|nr:NADH-quinone oxidoreductase subunit NuoN [Burkholderiales bacterium]